MEIFFFFFFQLMGSVPLDEGSADMSDRNVNPKVRCTHYIHFFVTFDNNLYPDKENLQIGFSFSIYIF